MNNWSIGRKLFGGIAAMTVAALISGGVALWTASSLQNELNTATDQTTPKIELALRIQQNAVAIRSEQRRVLLSGFGKDTAMARQAEEAIAAVLRLNAERLREIEPFLINAEGKRLVRELGEIARQWEGTNQKVQQLVAAGDIQGAWSAARAESNPLVDRMDKLTNDLLALQMSFLEESKAQAAASYSRAWATIVILLVITMGLAAGVIFVVRGITRTLNETAEQLGSGAAQVVSAASQVATAAQSLSQGATEQAASLEETSASMEEMASMTRKNAESSRHAATLVADVDRSVNDSNRSLAAMVTSMSRISESSGKISKIIKTIDEIAFQTNILALNAAVEAARAGEAGMGFAVVADEVRSLAQRSAQAAKDTASLIEESIALSQDGTRKVDEVATSIASITGHVASVKGIVEEVSIASGQQSQGIDQVSQAIAQMEKVTQGTAATAEESAAASEELNAQAETSMAVVSRLEVLVSGAARRTMAAPARPPVRPGAAVVSLPSRGNKPRSVSAAEEQIPLEGTGTYGRF